LTVSRRELLSLCSAAATLRAQDQRIRRELFLKAPGKGTAVMAFAYYTRAKGLDMMSIEQRWSRSDTMDVCYLRRSSDHGKTWSNATERVTGEKLKDGAGMLRRHLRGYWPDPGTGATIEFWNEGILPTDDPLEGLRRWQIHYTISHDGMATASPRQVIRQKGQPDSQPLPGVFPGKNSITIGDQGSQPLAVRGGFLLPCEITPIDKEGKLYNPGGGYTYHYSVVLHAKWAGKSELEWRISDPIEGDPARTTRGAIEPTIGRLADGRYILVMRGSNDRKPQLPSWRWVSYSKDAIAWTKPEPWTYSNGNPFFSPSACSQLLHHSSGKLLWIGNITPENPRGNRPRYPLVIGEVDARNGLLKQESVRSIDTRGPEDHELLTLSNFYAREDRVTKEVVVHMTRMFAHADGWEGDAFAYRIKI
jgi:hypothetical protein